MTTLVWLIITAILGLIAGGASNIAFVGWLTFALMFLFGLGPCLRNDQQRSYIKYEQYRADRRQEASDERTNAQRAASAQTIAERPVDQRSVHLHQHTNGGEQTPRFPD